MVTRRCTMAGAVCILLTTSVLAAEEPKRIEWPRFQCFLYPDPDGRVWAARPLASLGMIGVPSTPPVRLSPALVPRFAPLLTRVADAPKNHDPWWFGRLPRAVGGAAPTILVSLRATLNPVQQASSQAATRSSWGGPPDLYEIAPAQLIDVEFVSPQWLDAWDALDQALKAAVAQSLVAPDAEKRERLARQIEKGSRALNVMMKARASDEQRAMVLQISSEARVSRDFQERVEREWGRMLQQCVATLRIKPETPLPEPQRFELRKWCPTVEILARSESAAAFMAEIRTSWPAETLKQEVMYSPKLRRSLRVGEIEPLSPEGFEAFRAEARDERARREADKRKPAENLKARFGMTLRPASADLLAEKMILRGAVVAEVSNAGPNLGLEAGDLIIDYQGTYGLVMDQADEYGAAARLDSVALIGGEIRVLRGNQLITMKVEKPGRSSSTKGP